MDVNLPVRRDSRQGFFYLTQELFGAEAALPGRFFIASPWIDTRLLCSFLEGNIAHAEAVGCSEVHVLTREESLARLKSDPLPARGKYGILGYPCKTFHFKVYAKEIQPGVVRFVDTSANLTSAHLDGRDGARNADSWKAYTTTLEGFLKTYWWPQLPRAPQVRCLLGCTPDTLTRYSVAVDSNRQCSLLHAAGILYGDSRRAATEDLLNAGLPSHADDMLEALCTAVGLLSLPRGSSSHQPRANDGGEDVVEPLAGQDASAAQPSIQPQLRHLVAQLLNSFDVANRAQRMPDVYASLNIILDRKDADVVACPDEWHAIASAIGRKDAPDPASKRPRGIGSVSGTRDRSVIRNGETLQKPGTWHSCKQCNFGRYIPNEDRDSASRQCWKYSCKFSTTAKAWRGNPQPSDAEAARWRCMALGDQLD